MEKHNQRNISRRSYEIIQPYMYSTVLEAKYLNKELFNLLVMHLKES